MIYWHEFIHYLFSGGHWSGPAGLLARIVQHLGYSFTAIAIATAISLPIGLWLGHVGRGGAVASNVSNVGRAVPAFAILTLLFLEYGDHRATETVATLTVFALAPLLTNTYVSVRGVDRATVEAARGMGMSGLQVLRRVELPLSVPLILTGLRIAAVQVIGTATIAAYIGAGGLGRPVVDGFSQSDYGQLLAGAVLVAALALLVDGVLALVQRRLSPKGRPVQRRVV